MITQYACDICGKAIETPQPLLWGMDLSANHLDGVLKADRWKNVRVYMVAKIQARQVNNSTVTIHKHEPLHLCIDCINKLFNERQIRTTDKITIEAENE